MRFGHVIRAKPWILVVFTLLLMRAAKGAEPMVVRVLALVLIGFWSWYFLQMGVSLHAKSSGTNEKILSRFKSGVGYVFLYAATIIWFPSDEFLLNNYGLVEYGWRWAVVPFGLCWIVAVFQTLYLLSRWIAECRSKSGHEEHWGTYMLLFWFYPVGIFVVQPRAVALLK